MNSSAQTTNHSILITEAGTFLGHELAKAYLAKNYLVYGISHTTLEKDLITKHNFTLLEIDLSQPLPAYLPNFDIIFDLSVLKNSKISLFSQMPSLSPQTENIISQLKVGTKLFVISKITTSEDFYDYLTKNDSDLKKKLKLILVGDIYGPGMSEDDQNELGSLIFQAAHGDKVILQDEGLRQIYPAYITDVIESILGIASEESLKQIYRLASERAKTSLTTAYEIQDASRLVLGKELGLFFSGPEKQTTHEPEIIISGHDTSGKTPLKEGLKLTLQYLQDHHKVEAQKTDNTHMPQHQVISLPKEQQKTPVNFRFKNTLLIFILLLVLAIGKTILDVYLGATNLKSAKSALESGDFNKAKDKAKSAQKAFHAASNKTKFVKSLNSQLAALETGSAAAGYFIEGSEALTNNFYIITHSESTQNPDKETPSVNFQKAASLSAYAASLLTYSKNSQIHLAKQEFTDLMHLSQSAYELSNLVDDITAAGTKKTYLILLQNNTELRPGGGFIGNFATVQFNQGKLGEISVEDVYTIDGQLKEKIEPPKELKEKLGTTQLYLRDSNWSPDNTINAQTERDLFKKETGKEVDAVITVDLSFIQEILDAVGPIRLEDYKEDITSKNLFEKGEYYSEIGFFPGSTQKRDFFGALTRAMITKLIHGDQKTSNSLSQIAVAKAVKNALHNKHMMLTFDNPNLSTYIATHGWNQPLPPLIYNPADDSFETRDFVAISEANVGANKVNRFIDRKISYEMTIGRDADLVAKLKITYTNNSQADTWPGGKYTNFLRVYVPANATLLEVKNGDDADTKKVQTLSQGYLTAFATFVEVPIKSTKEIELTYRVPKNIKLETNPIYHLYVFKQPGTQHDPLTFTFNLPQYLQIKSINGAEDVSGKQNVKTETGLLEDRQFAIEVMKK